MQLSIELNYLLGLLCVGNCIYGPINGYSMETKFYYPQTVMRYSITSEGNVL